MLQSGMIPKPSRLDCRRAGCMVIELLPSFGSPQNKTSRILLAPDQRSPNDLVLIGASEMPQEPFQSLIVNERCKRTALCASPSMQLDRIAAVIDVALKRW